MDFSGKFKEGKYIKKYFLNSHFWGFCVETRLNITSVDNTTITKIEEENNDVEFSQVTDYEIKIYFNSSIQPDAAPNTFALSLVFLRFAGDAIKWPTIIPLVGAAHMIMERDALNILQVVEILKIIRNDLPNSELVPFNSSYEYCVWRTNSELAINGGWKCPSEFITNVFCQ
uniref:Uncharacterized protein n=1 Tax=Meloidogyne enterolobii TaxID=390850 RepID=A0A6V7WPS7_MELEN|nr:unnamed protein product [Meloidogyne enterolobii]